MSAERMSGIKLFAVLGGICVFLLLPGPAAAQTDAGNTAPRKSFDLFEMSIEELSTIKVSTVTGASKYEQKVTEAPSSISVITADEIRKYGHRTLADVLRSVRSFSVTYDRNYSYYGVRGFNRPGDYNTRILLMVDGHRINDNVYDQAPLGTEFLLDVDLIDRIEVIRGPGSSLYGSNAFFAVINVITKNGRDLHGAEASASAASFETWYGRLSFGGERTGGPDFLFSASSYDSKGARRLHYPEFSSVNGGVAENRDKDRFHGFFAKTTIGDFTLAGAYGYREKEVPTASFESVFNEPDNRTIDKNAYIDLTYRHDHGNGFITAARAYYDIKDYWQDYVLDYPPLTTNRDTAFGTWRGAELQVNATVLSRHKVTTGMEYKDNQRQDQSNFDIDPPITYLDDKRKSRLRAFYLQDEYRIHETTLLNIGVRNDHHSSFGETTNPRLALIYSPVEKTIFKLLYGTAFRAPTVYELYYADGITAKHNPGLKPEKIKTYELVYEQYLGTRVRTSFSGFFYRIDNLISSVTDTVDGMSLFLNADRTEARGAEVELEGTWPGGVQGRVSCTLQKTKDARTGEVLTNSPRRLAKANLAVPLVRDALFADPELQYASRRKTVGGAYADAFTVVNLTLLARIPSRGLDASFTVYNVFDERYGDPGAGPPQHAQDVIEQDGRTFRIKLTYSF